MNSAKFVPSQFQNVKKHIPSLYNVYCIIYIVQARCRMYMLECIVFIVKVFIQVSSFAKDAFLNSLT